MATHQIRAPLTAIEGYASLIEQGDFGVISKELKEPVTQIFKSSDSLVQIVEDFLDVSRIEQGSMKYQFVGDVDFMAVVNDVISELKPGIIGKGLSLSVYLPSQPLLIYADKGKLRQIVNNLIDNAVKYTVKGSITVKLSKEAERQKALFSVSDTGVGIDAKTLPKLFEKFSRAEGADSVNIIGTGLGLYVAKQLTRAHGGKIWAESAGNGQSSTFFVCLPIKGPHRP